MSADLERLLKQIEELRRHLYEISKDKDFTDPEVVVASQKLDAVLNEYFKLIKQKQKK
ncbi:hypothetical protein BSNK01_05190 [Bacillaceae bacterium]